MAAERSRRLVRARGQLIEGQYVLHCNNYTLEEGERSVWDQELSAGIEWSESVAPIRTDLAKAPRTARPLSTLRAVSAEEASRSESNKVGLRSASSCLSPTATVTRYTGNQDSSRGVREPVATLFLEESSALCPVPRGHKKTVRRRYSGRRPFFAV